MLTGATARAPRCITLALLDDNVVLTGSYNWTFASEQENYENVLILREPQLVDTYHAEFEALWEEAKQV